MVLVGFFDVGGTASYADGPVQGCLPDISCLRGRYDAPHSNDVRGLLFAHSIASSCRGVDNAAWPNSLQRSQYGGRVHLVTFYYMEDDSLQSLERWCCPVKYGYVLALINEHSNIRSAKLAGATENEYAVRY